MSEEGLWSGAKRWVSELRARSWNRGAHVSADRPIIVGGCGRSGTTLLRVILDSHSQVCCGPESNLFASSTRLNPGSAGAHKLARKFDLAPEIMDDLLRRSRTRAEFIDAFFDAYRKKCGKPLWADKTPRNVQALPYILEHFPRARLVHMLRDGRDVICSLRTHPRHRVVDGKIIPLHTWNPIEQCTSRWVQDVRLGLHHRGDPRYFEIRYEDLVQSPEATLRPLFEFLELPWEPAVLRFHEVRSTSRDPTKFAQNPEATRPLQATALGRWRRDLNAADLAYVVREAGALLREVGYLDVEDMPPDHDTLPRIASDTGS